MNDEIKMTTIPLAGFIRMEQQRDAALAEAARYREELISRQRFIHAEMHTDAKGRPIGYWQDCNQSTCKATSAALAAAAGDGPSDAGATGGREG